MKEPILIQLYRAEVSPLKDPAFFEACRRAVSPARREKTDRLRFAADKRLSLGAELLFMLACRERGLIYGREPLTENEYKKPLFANRDLYFNLSHSGGTVLCAMADIPVGCDTEKIGSADMVIAKRFFHAEEYRALLACPEEERNDLFYRLWTLKESFLKCAGSGLYVPLNGFSVGIEAQTVTLGQTPDTARFRFFETDPGDGYKYACCARLPEGREEEPLRAGWRQITLSESLLL